MLLKKLAAATAGLALLASGPAAAAGSVAPLPIAVAAVAQDVDDGEESTFERYLPIAVVVIFSAVFAYFLFDTIEEDDDRVSP